MTLRALSVVVALVLLTNAFAAVQGKDRLARIEASRTLRVCIWPDYYGISYRNPKSLQLSGVDIDNAYAVASELGAQVQFVDSSFATLIDDVSKDACDIAMFAIGLTPARMEKLRFTTPHLRSDIYAITTKSNRRIQSRADIDRPGVVLAVAKGTLQESAMRAKLKQAELLVVNAPAAREQEVQAGRADAFMTDYPFSRRMLENSDWARLVAPTETYHMTDYGWAMAPGDDRFHARIEAILAQMKRDGRLLANARKHGMERIAAQ